MANTREIKKKISKTIIRLDTELQLLDQLQEEIRDLTKKRDYFGKKHENKIHLLTLASTMTCFFSHDARLIMAAVLIGCFSSGAHLMLNLNGFHIPLGESTASIRDKTEEIFFHKRNDESLFHLSIDAEYETRKKFKCLEENLALARQHKLSEFDSKTADLEILDPQLLLSNAFFLKSLGTFSIGLLSFLLLWGYRGFLRDTLGSIEAIDGKSCSEMFIVPGALMMWGFLTNGLSVAMHFDKTRYVSLADKKGKTQFGFFRTCSPSAAGEGIIQKTHRIIEDRAATVRERHSCLS